MSSGKKRTMQLRKETMAIPFVFLGLVLGFFSILVYYAVSTHLLQMSNTILGQNKMVVFYAYDNIAADVASLVDSECLPKIELASCISYSNPDYDIVGLLYDEQTEASGVGELVSAKWADQLVCTVSEDIREDGIASGSTAFGCASWVRCSEEDTRLLIMTCAGYRPVQLWLRGTT